MHPVWIYFNVRGDCTTLLEQRTYLSTYDNIGLNILNHSLLSTLGIVLLCHYHLKLTCMNGSADGFASLFKPSQSEP